MRLLQVKLGDDGVETLHLIVKCGLPGQLGHFQKFMEPLKKELAWYTKVAPMLAKRYPVFNEIAPRFVHGFCERLSRGPTCWERACCALCYKPCWSTEKGLLIMEDLTKASPRPYYLLDKTKVPNLGQMRLAMEALGHFHGAFWRLLNEPEEGAFDGAMSRAEVAKFYENPTRLFKFLVKHMFMNKQKKVMGRVLDNRGADPDLKARLGRYDADARIEANFELINTSRIITVLHGDFWPNNMMFRDGEAGEPDAVKILDFQMMKNGHPSFDLGYFLYIATDRAFRKAHLEQCLGWYFDVFSSYFSGIMDDYGFDDFKREFHETRGISSFIGLSVRDRKGTTFN